MEFARRDDWNTNPLPDQRTTIPLDRVFTALEMEQVRHGVVPEAMEDKWFLYWQDDRLFCHRSWTGNCLYVARFVPEGDGHRLVSADVNRDPSQYSETRDEVDAVRIHELIDVVLLGRLPDLASREDDPQAVLASWGRYGRAILGTHPGDGSADEWLSVPPSRDDDANPDHESPNPTRRTGMDVKVKKRGFGLEMRTFTGTKDESYLVFRTSSGSFHTFLEVEAKQAARACGATDEGTTRQMWERLWREGTE